MFGELFLSVRQPYMRVIIADHHLKAQKALCALIREESGVGVVGVVSAEKDLLELVEKNPPDVILLEFALPLTSITNLIAQIRSINPSIKVIVMSSDPENARFALMAGANAFASKGDSPHLLLDTLHRYEME
jgi:DNA-binding NarL/FixJ family response regulator